jgi:hypothetical protein
MDTIYRLHTNKTIGFFKNKDDAISLLHHINNAKVEVFQNLTPIGIYEIKNKQLYFNESVVQLDGYLNKWFKTTSTDDNELNLFIPINDTTEQKPIDMEKYLDKIKQLERDAESYENNLKIMRDDLHTKQDELKSKKTIFTKDKRQFDKEKEEWIQFKTKLEADKRVFFIIKEQLESGELTEESIPVLFQDKYPIFKYLDDNNLLDQNDILTSNDISNYLSILPNYKSKNSELPEDSMFSSSDPLYLMKKYETEISTE